MYIIFGCFFLLCVFFYGINHRRRKCIIKRICCMNDCQKIKQLNTLLEPFGFCYQPAQDIISSTQDAWQRPFGYRSLYDKTAPRFSMIYDCEPIYFNYQNHTYLLEFWKGQYGINTGAEIGLYRADTLLLPHQYEHTQFHSVSDAEMLPMSIRLYQGKNLIFYSQKKHWWLTGFKTGMFHEPEELTMHASISFKDLSMLNSFMESLKKIGYCSCHMAVCGLTLSFAFTVPHTKQYKNEHSIHTAFMQWKNKKFCQLYCYITKPFYCTPERLLYLYYYLPPILRHLFRFRKCKKQKCKNKKK